MWLNNSELLQWSILQKLKTLIWRTRLPVWIVLVLIANQITRLTADHERMLVSFCYEGMNLGPNVWLQSLCSAVQNEERYCALAYSKVPSTSTTHSVRKGKRNKESWQWHMINLKLTISIHCPRWKRHKTWWCSLESVSCECIPAINSLYIGRYCTVGCFQSSGLPHGSTRDYNALELVSLMKLYHRIPPNKWNSVFAGILLAKNNEYAQNRQPVFRNICLHKVYNVISAGGKTPVQVPLVEQSFHKFSSHL